MSKKTDINTLLTRKTKRHINWFDRLSPGDQQLAIEARRQIREHNLEVLPLARNFVERFELSVSPYTVATWIRAYEK